VAVILIVDMRLSPVLRRPEITGGAVACQGGRWHKRATRQQGRQDGTMVVELRAKPSNGGEWWAPVLWTLGTVLLIGLLMAFVDRPVATYAHDVLHRPAWGVLLQRPAELPFRLALLGLVMSMGAYAVQGALSPGWRTILTASIATVLATGAVLLLKYLCGRMWPETWVHNNPSWITNHAFGFLPMHGGGGYASFPSGHTARITAPFAVFWQCLPRFRPLWLLPSLIVTAGLLVSDYHFASDCVAGIWLGAACAWFVLLFV
jgi:membrane-associated phospholipid phosphatase